MIFLAGTGAVLGWWEFDIYTGIAGLLVIGLGVIAWLLLRKQDLGFPALLCPSVVLSLFSVRNIYGLMRFFRIPLFSGERVSSRFLILPFIFILILGMTALQRFTAARSFSKPVSALLTAGLVPAAASLWRHLNIWKVTEAFKGFPYTHTDLSIKTVANHPDAPYTTGLLIGLIITVLSAVVILYRAKRSA